MDDTKVLPFALKVQLRHLIGLMRQLIPGDHDELSRAGQPLNPALNLLQNINMHLHRTFPNKRHIPR